MKGSSTVLDVGVQLEHYLWSIRDFLAEDRPWLPILLPDCIGSVLTHMPTATLAASIHPLPPQTNTTAAFNKQVDLPGALYRVLERDIN